MSPVRLIAIDLDGTLLDKQGVVSPATLEAIKKAAEATLIVVATGRRTRKAIQLSSPLPFDHHLISCSGAHVEHRPSGKHLLNRFFDADIVGRILRVFSSLEMGAVMFSPDCCGELTVMHGRRPAQHMETYLSRAADSIRGFADVGGNLPTDVHFVSSIGDAETLEAARDAIGAELGFAVNMNLIRNITGSGCALDVLPQGVSKWSALEMLIERLGIGVSETAAIGDDENDIEMLRKVGVSIAMGNARPEVRSAAMHTTESHENDGVSKALRDILGYRC